MYTHYSELVFLSLIEMSSKWQQSNNYMKRIHDMIDVIQTYNLHCFNDSLRYQGKEMVWRQRFIWSVCMFGMSIILIFLNIQSLITYALMVSVISLMISLYSDKKRVWYRDQQTTLHDVRCEMMCIRRRCYDLRSDSFHTHHTLEKEVSLLERQLHSLIRV